MIEKDFNKIIKRKDIDFFLIELKCYNPLTKENLKKCLNKVTEVTKK